MELEKICMLNVLSEIPIKTRYGLLIPLRYLYISNPFKILLKNVKMRFYEKEWGNSLQIFINPCYFSLFIKLTNYIISSNIQAAKGYRDKLRCFSILKTKFIWGRADGIKHLSPNNIYFGDVELTLKHIFLGEKGASASWIVKQVLMPTKNRELSYFVDSELPC